MATEALRKVRYDFEQKIAHRVNAVRELIYSDTRPIKDLSACELTEHIKPAAARRLKYKPVKTGWRWGKMWSSAWFRLRFTVPAAYKGETVVLLFDCGGEACAFIDNKPIQGLDRNRDEIILLNKAKGGERFDIFVEAGCNDAFGRLDGKVTLSKASIAVLNPDIRDYYFDLEVCSQYIDAAPKDDTRSSKILFAANKSVDVIDFRKTDRDAIRADIREARTILKPVLGKKANASAQTFGAVGHAHIDVAWLWPLAETIRKCSRTFSTAIKLMDQYPEYRFAQSQPHLYEFTKNNYPELFKQIKAKIKKGQWEPVGCMWVEADCNVTSGESLVRQILFGTRFFKKEFNYDVDSLWLPDVFGYAASLPQILVKSGMKYFTTQKISWSQYTVFPYHSFTWKGIDGTGILSHFPPADSYNCMIKAGHILDTEKRYNEKDRCDYQLHQFGFGDGGGGPTKEQIERIRRYKDFEGMPRMEQMFSRDLFKKLEKNAEKLPEWVGELYLELHRATLTSQGYNKFFNRKAELLYRDAELFAAWDLMQGGTYPQDAINDGWKTILLNQFHDIIPGSSIGLVYEDSDRDYMEVLQNGENVLTSAQNHLAAKMGTAGLKKPVVLNNSLSWQRGDIAEIEGITKNTAAIGPDGIPRFVQSIGDRGYFFADVPPMGSAVYDIDGKAPAVENTLTVTEKLLENPFFRIKLDKNGSIQSMLDKASRREVIQSGKRGNEFLLFEDRPNNWDAWDTYIFYNDKQLETAALIDSKIIAKGPVMGVLQQKRKVSQSTIIQDIIIYADVPRIDFRTEVQWGNESQVLLKAAFPVDVHSDTARYEIQYGSLERPAHWNKPSDMAQFEVCGHKWADVSEGAFGVSLLNDSKYGHDIKGGIMRLSLLRAPKNPDPQADINKTHTFTYSLYPHSGDFRTGTVRQGYELNVPLTTVTVDGRKTKGEAQASLMSVDVPNAVIETVKKHEDSRSLIVRLYEAHEERSRVKLQFGFKPKKVVETDLMERDIKALACRSDAVRFTLKPFEIKTFRVEY